MAKNRRQSRHPTLSAKQQRFVQEYLVDLSASAAYQRAGYKAKGNAAEVNASRLLRNAQVKEAIAESQSKLAAKLEIKAEDVLREYQRIANSDLGDIYDFSGSDLRLRPLNTISRDARRAIASIKVRRTVKGRGNKKREVVTTEIKLWDKMNAQEKLARHLGLLKDAAAVIQVPFKVYLGIDPAEVTCPPQPANPLPTT